MKKKLLRAALGVVVVLVVLVVVLVGYVEASWSSSLHFTSTPSPAIHASNDPALIERGRLLAHGVAHCAACHATIDAHHPELLRGEPPLSGGSAITPPFGVFIVPNITPDRETGIGAWTDEEIARVIRTGVRRDGELSIFMRFSVGELSDEDLTALVSYLRSTDPVSHVLPPSEPNFIGRAFVTFAGLTPDARPAMAHVPEGLEPSLARGEYLAEGPGLCVGCHSPADPESMFETDRSRLLSGGDPIPTHIESEGDTEYAGPNLTSDAETGATGRLTEDAFLDRFRTIGRTGLGSPMAWENFARLSDSDLRSIYRYLRSAPAIRRDNGPSSRRAGSFTPQ